MPGARIELALCRQNRILSPARLPVPPSRPAKGAQYSEIDATFSAPEASNITDMASQFAPEPPAGLLDRAAAGEEAAFTELYRLYSTPVYTVAMRMLASREPAEEVLQEVFIELLRALRGRRRGVLGCGA